MNLDSLKDTWNNQEQITNHSVEINQTLLLSVGVNRQMEQLQNMKVARITQSILFFIIIVSLWQYIISNFTFSAPTVSAMILNVFAIIALAGNIGQIVMISQFDFSAPVKNLQQNLCKITSHKLQMTKLVLLSVPFYMAYVFLGFDVLFNVDLYLYLSDAMQKFYIISTTVLLVVMARLTSKLKYTNISAPWVKKTSAFIVGKQFVELAEFLNNAETTQ